MAIAFSQFPLTAGKKFVPAPEDRPFGIIIVILPRFYESSASRPGSGILAREIGAGRGMAAE
jgi:hypothetical protein